MSEISNSARYSVLIAEAISRGRPFLPTSEDANSLQVERGVILANGADMTLVDRLIDLSTGDQLGRIAVVDAGGHRRPVYRPLLIYCWLRTFERRARSSWEPALRRWCEVLQRSSWEREFPAVHGASVAETVWAGLALRVAGELFADDKSLLVADEIFRNLCDHQQPDGAFLLATARDNPETLWYHELILLHAVASFAVRSGDAAVARSAERSAQYHLAETQPDHATAQPWGLPAFVRYAPLLADQVLHTMATQQPAGPDGVSLMLLADTMYGLADCSL